MTIRKISSGNTASVLAFAAFAALAWAVPQSAYADCDQAEKLRLGEESKKLAQRNAWSGVERSYLAMLRTKCDLSFEDYSLGAQSARYLGKTYEMYERLTAAKDFDPQPEILSQLTGLDSAYGRVEIKGDARRRPELVREQMPFAPDQRKSIEWAQEVVAGTGSFKGMLPLGAYGVGDQSIEVVQGTEWQVVSVGKQKGTSQRAESVGAINYANLVATIGPSFITTAEPGGEIANDNGDHQFAPHDIFASGFSLEAGGELGLTFRQPELGVAATFGYAGGFGTDTLHAMTGTLSAVLRPGQLRVAAGPSYMLLGGKGTGVATWFDVDHDVETDPNETLRYQGMSWGGGVKGSVGYGVLDLEKLRGVVELGGSWHSDGARNFATFGLRVGVIPAVPRFHG